MAYQKIYSREYWENFPSEKTAINRNRLNNIEGGIDAIDDRVCALDTTKVDLTKANELVKEILWDESNGTLTVVKMNGSRAVIDTNLEKLAVNFTYNPQTQQLVITLDDGTVQNVDLSSLITEYEFLDSDTIAFEIVDGKVKAIVKNGSITENHLAPEYLAEIRTQVGKAEMSAKSADASEKSAVSSSALSKSYAVGGTGTREGEDTDNAKYYMEQAKSVSAVEIMTTEKAGIGKPDGTTITVDEDGTMHGSSQVSEMTGATADKDGTSGTVPAPTAGQGSLFLRGDGTWAEAKQDLSAYYNNADYTNNKLQLKHDDKVLKEFEIKGSGGATITPKPTVNPQIKNDDKKVIITWEDPTDTVIEGSTFSKWAGTKLVMKESGYPTSPDDGTVLVDNTTRDKYKTTGFEKSGLTNDTVYYFALFPYSTDGVYNYDSGNRLLGEPTELKIVTFADGTDAEIAKMIQAHYANKINIADYWAVGDTRSVALSAMSATGVGESHRAQTVQFVIGDFDHDDLATPINGHTKAAVTLLQKDCLMDAANASNPVNGLSNSENGYMNSSNTNSGGWKNCARRTWCNNVFFAALPSVWQSIVKTVNKKSGTGGGSSSGTDVTTDKIFLASEIEIFGSATYSVSGEGTQYQYYKNATANRYKMPKWNSSSVSNIYWERSPHSGYTYHFCIVNSSGGAGYHNANDADGVAPCLCI